MKVKLTSEAAYHFSGATEQEQRVVLGLMGSFSAYAKGESTPGQNTMKRITKRAREVLGMRKCSRVFEIFVDAFERVVAEDASHSV